LLRRTGSDVRSLAAIYVAAKRRRLAVEVLVLTQ
jgi:hypothetical protein